MKCPNCNNELKSESVYCAFCGNKIENTFNESMDNGNFIINKEKTKHKLTIYIVAVIMIIVSISLAIYFSVGYQSYHTITFDARGGICSPTSIQYKDGKITFPIPTRDNYIFLGWYATSDKVSSNSKIAEKYFAEHSHAFGNTTLYAHWGQYQQITINRDNYSKYLTLRMTENSIGTVHTVYIVIDYIFSYLTFAERLYKLNQISVTVQYNGVSQTATRNEVGSLSFSFTGSYGGARITSILGSVTCVAEVE